jgi:hypothetical protein
MMTAVVTRRAAQGDVLHGVLGTYVIRHYATRIYGPDWDKPHANDLFDSPLGIPADRDQ